MFYVVRRVYSVIEWQRILAIGRDTWIGEIMVIAGIVIVVATFIAIIKQFETRLVCYYRAC